VAIFTIGMTQEQVIAALEPIIPDHYRIRFEGFLKGLDGSIFFSTQAGGKMVKARFSVVSNGTEHGKSLVYLGVIGQFSFANLAKALPIMTGSGIDDEAAIGTECEADVTLEEYTDRDGNEAKGNKIKKLKGVM